MTSNLKDNINLANTLRNVAKILSGIAEELEHDTNRLILNDVSYKEVEANNDVISTKESQSIFDIDTDPTQECSETDKMISNDEDLGRGIDLRQACEQPIVKEVGQLPDLYYEKGRPWGSTIIKFDKCRLVKYQKRNKFGVSKFWCKKCDLILCVKNYIPCMYGEKVEVTDIFRESNYS
uniref:PiggyBac transposable element-derived protein 4 C-terminal zinc-ribbon domain-containing protein n=1 Tax=Panagrolaimus sp. ES5 TaxID=591445 RepID=A0AC34FJ19_9BILA